MNSTDDGKNVFPNEEMPSCSRVNSDNNANTNNNVDQSKGAIPKTKIIKKNGVSSSTRKSVKINNNIEHMATLNCVVNSTSDVNKLNGYSKASSTTNVYLTNSLSHKNHEHNNGLTCTGSDIYEFAIEVPIEDDYRKLSYIPITKRNSRESLSVNGYHDAQFYPHKSDSDSSSEDNELLSMSDDGCIYTYKADNVADLPRSFFNIEIPPLENIEHGNDNRHDNSSPEMDFLEMDFDPGPSGDPEEAERLQNNPVSIKPSSPPTLNIQKEVDQKPPIEETKSDSLRSESVKNNYEEMYKIIQQFRFKTPPIKKDLNMPWSCHLSERTRHRRVKTPVVGPVSWLTNNGSQFIPDKVMLWTESEAKSKQITQIAPSSCGATAVLNVLNALRIPLPTSDKIQELVNTRFRANSAPLPEYLLSRSKAGCNHRDLIQGLYKASEGTVYSRFFSLYPERFVNLYKWLGYWITQGAVPIATLNLQKTNGHIPDSWHHQMIYGIGPEGIYMTNPLMCVQPDELWPQLSSESVLLIRRHDVLSRYNSKTDLPKIINIDDVRWQDLNVPGQVANIIREARRVAKLGSNLNSHLRIPAEYRSGITLAIDMKSPAFTFLSQCPELPFLSDCKPDVPYYT